MTKHWTLKEGTAVALGLTVVGLVMQLIAGPVDWSSIAWPINFILLVIYIVLLIAMYALRSKVYPFRRAMTHTAAVPAIGVGAVATMVYGLTNWQGTLSCWPFVLLYIWITTIVGLASIHRIVHFKLRNIPFLLNHLGLFMAIVCATLGNADMRRLRMEVKGDMAEWRAFDEDTKRIVELPLAIQLNRFTLDEYPARLMLQSTQEDKATDESILLEYKHEEPKGMLGDWQIEVMEYHDKCVPTFNDSILSYEPSDQSGATTATLIKATNLKTKKTAEGWVSNGSYMYPYQFVSLDDHSAIVMPEREPRRYVSDVELYTESGKHEHGLIEVNKPYKLEGWKIYQYSYDTSKGRWSEVSVLELVRDPWLPFVYAGIYMLIAGAVWMFVTAGKRKEDAQ